MPFSLSLYCLLNQYPQCDESTVLLWNLSILYILFYRNPHDPVKESTVFSFPVQYLTLLQYSSRMLTSRWQESKGSFVLSQYLFSILYTHLMISLKFVFNEKPPLLNITLSPVKLSNFWDCLARTNFEQNWKICWVVLPLTSVISCCIVWTFMLLILLGV